MRLADLEILQQSIAELIECRRIFDPAPNPGRDLIKAKAITRIGVERDQLVAEVGFHQVDGAMVTGIRHQHSPFCAPTTSREIHGGQASLAPLRLNLGPVTVHYRAGKAEW